jgi:hypothetical protein
MKIPSANAFFKAFALLAVLFFASLALAKDMPVDAKSVLGRWVLLDVKTKEVESRAVVLATKLDMTFQANRALIVSSRNPAVDTGTDTRKGVYLVENGKIIVKLEGETKEDPARAVIRDGKHLVFLPTDKFPGEMIFAKVGK